MKVIEFIREKTEQFQRNNHEFRAKLEPQFKNWTDKFSQKLANTLNNPWISLFKPTGDDEKTEEKPLVQCKEAENAYNELKDQLGEENYVGEWFTVTQECIDQFANVTGDHQWIHTDVERAKEESPFKTTIAHGFLTLSLIPVLTDTVDPEKNPYPDAKMVVNYGLNQVRFPFPVRSGSRVRARSTTVDLIPMKRSIELVNEVSIEIENSKRLACVAHTVLRLYF